MRGIKNLIMTGMLTVCYLATAQAQETSTSRWNAESVKTEPASADQLKKLAADISDFKFRLQQLEDSIVQQHNGLKSQFQTMQSRLSALHASCDRLQRDVVVTRTATASSILQTSATEPATRKAVEEGNKTEPAAQDAMMKRLDEISGTLHEISKLNLQVQANTRDLNDLKKKYDALQLEFIQAQNDIGKLQQDLARSSIRSDAGRSPTDSSNRQSLALPLPPESTLNTTTPRATTGALKLINNYPLTVTAVVDGQFYTLRPNDTVTLNRNPGYVTYEVVGIQGNTLRTINAGETLSVQIVAR